MADFKQTSNLWYDAFMKTHKTRILDPDGWDRQNYRYSFYEEEITEMEFNNRLMFSTCMNVLEDWIDDNTPGKNEI